MKRVTVPIDEKFVMFDTAEECAEAAAPVFVANRWRWTRCGIPNRDDLLQNLRMLEREIKTHPALQPHAQCGRCIYYHGRFGYERPKVKESQK